MVLHCPVWQKVPVKFRIRITFFSWFSLIELKLFNVIYVLSTVMLRYNKVASEQNHSEGDYAAFQTSYADAVFKAALEVTGHLKAQRSFWETQIQLGNTNSKCFLVPKSRPNICGINIQKKTYHSIQFEWASLSRQKQFNDYCSWRKSFKTQSERNPDYRKIQKSLIYFTSSTSDLPGQHLSPLTEKKTKTAERNVFLALLKIITVQEKQSYGSQRYLLSYDSDHQRVDPAPVTYRENIKVVLDIEVLMRLTQRNFYKSTLRC